MYPAPPSTNSPGVIPAPQQQGAPVFAPPPPAPQQLQPQQFQQQTQPQQFQPAPQQQQQQFQPVQQPAQQQMIPLIAPNPNNPVAPQQQQQTQPAQQQNAYQPIYQALATSLKTTPEHMQQMIQDNPQVMAALVSDAITQIRAGQAQSQQIPIQGQQQQQQQPAAATNGKIDIPPAAYNFLVKNDKGIFVPVDPSYQQYANAANHNDMIDRSKAQQFLQNPAALLDDASFQAKIQQTVEQQVQQRLALQESVQQRTAFREKYGRELVQMTPDGQMAKSPLDGSPLLTPLGFSFDQWARKLNQQGMKESSELYMTALTMAKNELGLNQPQQQQQQQFQPLNVLGQQQPQFAPQFQPQVPLTGYQFQGQQPPAFNALMQQSLNANSYWPGQPPARNNMPAPNTTIEGALALALQDVPDGGDMNTYFSKIGPSLFN